jgi:hypothetical protein
METLSCPTIVLCVEPTGAAIGERLARVQRGQLMDSPLFLWAVHVDEDVPTIAPIKRCEDVVAQIGQGVAYATIGDGVAALVADVLSLRDWRIPPMMERPVGLRLSLVGAPWEIKPSLLLNFAAAFHSSAQKHVGVRYFTEACFLLPDLVASAPPDAAERVQDLVSLIDGDPDSSNSHFLAGSFSYCWWFGRINASGLTLASFPSVIEDIATVIHGLLTTAPEHLPRSQVIISGRPQHMSVGYGELFAPREEVFECLKARYACQLIQRLFLDKSNRVDHKRARRRAWDFTLSSECIGALREIELTPGGERIWKGFHPEIPEQVMDGEVEEFLFNMQDSLEKFFNIDLLRLRSDFELSSCARREALLTGLESEVRDIAERASGGLFEAQAFLAEVEAFLLKTDGLSEGERPINLQEIRRWFDIDFAKSVHPQGSASIDELGAKVRDLQEQLRQLTRLRNISAPPALEAGVYEALRWSEDNQAQVSLDERIERLSEQLQEEVRLWGQKVANAEEDLQGARREIEPDEARRDQKIKEREEMLRQAALKYRILLFELAQAIKTADRLWFGRFRLRRALKEKNERLGKLRDVMLPQLARQVVAAYAERMQLSIDRAVYEVRDSIIQDALKHGRELHKKVVDAIDMLNGIRDDLSDVQVPTASSVLRRSVVTDVDLESLVKRLTNGAAEPGFPMRPSASDVCFQPATKTAGQIQEEAGKPFTVILSWRIADFVTLLGPQSAKVEALIGWLKHVSQPLFPFRGEDTVNYSIVRAVDDPSLGRLLRHAFPEAAWPDDPKTPAAVVLQFMQIPRVDGYTWDVRP